VANALNMGITAHDSLTFIPFVSSISFVVGNTHVFNNLFNNQCDGGMGVICIVLYYNSLGREVRAAVMPDNIDRLLALRDEGILVGTPAQDYDDTYCLNYAIKHNAFIVSNDRYRDNVNNLKGHAQHEVYIPLHYYRHCSLYNIMCVCLCVINSVVNGCVLM
jgi:hypothetical protein